MFVASCHNTMAGAQRIAAEAHFREIRVIEPVAPKMTPHLEYLANLARARRREAIKAAEAYAEAYCLEHGEAAFRHTYLLIEKRICRALRVTKAELRSNRRSRHIVFARQAIMYWSARLTNRSLPELGRLMGGMDHTTILHGKKAYAGKRLAQGRYLRPAR